MSNNDLWCSNCKSHHHPVECPKDEEPMNPENEVPSECRHVDTLGRNKCDRCGLPIESWIRNEVPSDEDLKKANEALTDYKNMLRAKHPYMDSYFLTLFQNALSALRAEWKREKEEIYEINFRQAAKINSITGARNQFYNDLAEVLGLDPMNDENPKIVDCIKSLKSEKQALEARVRELEKTVTLPEHASLLREAFNRDWKDNFEKVERENDRLKAENERLQFDLDHGDKLREQYADIVDKAAGENLKTIDTLTCALAEAHHSLSWIKKLLPKNQEELDNTVKNRLYELSHYLLVDFPEAIDCSLSNPTSIRASEEMKALRAVRDEYIAETVELVFNSAEQARKEGVPSCNFYDLERLIAKTDIPQSSFRYVGSWKAYESIKRNSKALEAYESRGGKA